MVVDSVLTLGVPLIYTLAGALAFLESALVAGLVIPGTAALLLGGAVSAYGHGELALMLVVGALGAIIGDSAGYARGRHKGPALRRGRVGTERWERVETFVAQRGPVAVFAGRWFGLMRALVPTFAGTTLMPYRRFLLWSVCGAVSWSCTVITVGYLAGTSWQWVQMWLGDATLLVGILLALSALLALTTHWSIRYAGNVRQLLAHLRSTPAFTWVRLRLDAVVQRSGPLPTAAKILVVGGAVIACCTVLLAKLFDNVLEGDGIALLDHPALTWLAAHRDDEMTAAMIVITNAGGTVALTLAATAVIAWSAWKRQWLAATLVATTGLGASALVTIGKAVVGRARPPRAGQLVIETNQSFPSGHALGSIAVLGVLTALAIYSQRRWATRAWTTAAALLAIGLIGLSRLYLGVHWPTDILSGWLVGAAWVTLCLTAAATAHRRRIRNGKSGSPATRTSPLQPENDAGTDRVTPSTTDAPDRSTHGSGN